MEELEKRIWSQLLTQLYRHMVPYDFTGISKSRLAGIKRLILLLPPGVLKADCWTLKAEKQER